MNSSPSELGIFRIAGKPAPLLLTVPQLRIEQNSLLHNAASLHPGMRWRIFAKQWSKLFLMFLHHLTWDEKVAFMSPNDTDVLGELAGVTNARTWLDDERRWIFGFPTLMTRTLAEPSLLLLLMRNDGHLLFWKCACELVLQAARLADFWCHQYEWLMIDKLLRLWWPKVNVTNEWWTRTRISVFLVKWWLVHSLSLPHNTAWSLFCRHIFPVKADGQEEHRLGVPTPAEEEYGTVAFD